jgi:hypothetical protein
MTLNIIKLKLEKTRSNCEYIVLRKNLKHLCVLGIFYNPSGLVKFSNAKVFVLDMPQIEFWVIVHKLQLPKWLYSFYRKLKHVSYLRNRAAASSAYPEVDRNFVVRTSTKDFSRIRKNTFRSFYKKEMVSRSWFDRVKNDIIKSNVDLYSKKV